MRDDFCYINMKRATEIRLNSQDYIILKERRERSIKMEEKKLYKSRTNRMICGVCGGLAEYLNLDATIIRLVFAVLILTGVSILFYIAAAIIIPERY